MAGSYKNRKIRWGRELSDAEYDQWIAEQDDLTTRVTGKHGLRMIGLGKLNEEWSAVIEALAEHGAIPRSEQVAAARALHVKNFRCISCGSSSGFARRDRAGIYDGIRLSCSHRCRTRDSLVTLGLSDNEEYFTVTEVGADAFGTPGGGKPDESTRRMVLTVASDIKPRRVNWLWDGRIALGTLALLAGREGLGKSTLAYWKAARITRGELPGEYLGTPKSVLVCATEDSWEHTIVPRLIASDADLSRVYRVEVLSADDIHVGLSLPRDLHAVEQSAAQTDAALLLLDPLMSRLSDSLDTHRDADVRRALEPLVAVADRTGMAILGLIHHNKSGSSDPLQLVMGSKAFTAVARSVHTVVPDPDDEADERRLFGTPKNNLGRSNLPTLAFTVASHAVDTDDGVAWTGRIEWGDELTASIAEMMRRATESEGDKSATSEAADWLDDYLHMKGGALPSAEIKIAGRAAGHSADSLKRAAKKLHLKIDSSGFPRKTFWSYPEPDSEAESQSEQAGAPQSEQQLEQIPRGEYLTALTAPTGVQTRRSAQLAQLEQSDGDVTPTEANGQCPPLTVISDPAPVTQCRSCGTPLLLRLPGRELCATCKPSTKGA